MSCWFESLALKLNLSVGRETLALHGWFSSWRNLVVYSATSLNESLHTLQTKQQTQRLYRVTFMMVMMMMIIGLIWCSYATWCFCISSYVSEYVNVCVFSGEMFIPFYTGRVIDILGSHYQPNEFLSALLFMGLYSLGRYQTMLCFSPHSSTSMCLWLSGISNSLSLWLISSVSAGCRGGLLLCVISAFTCRVKVKLFEALTKQEIGFFETIKTGKALIIGLAVMLNNLLVWRTD